MPRNRSRSGSRDRDRDRDRERKRDKERDRERDRDNKHRDRKDRDRHRHRTKSRSRSRSRSKSPRHRSDKRSASPVHRSKRERLRSPSPHDSYLTLGNVKPKLHATVAPVKEPIILDPNALEGKTEEEIEMLKVMGFAGFDSTKGKHIEDGKANAFAVNVQQKRKYRQYMNRKGGFNRPLDPVA